MKDVNIQNSLLRDCATVFQLGTLYALMLGLVMDFVMIKTTLLIVFLMAGIVVFSLK